MSVHAEQNVDTDIYRGDPPSHLKEPAPSILSHASASSSTSTSSSSSSSVGGGGRLGAIAAKLELAISRWAKNVRGNSPSSVSSATSSTTSSSPSISSVVTLTKSQVARRRRRRTKNHSTSSLRTMQSELDIAARIERMKALEKFRLIPRDFKLYLPPGMMHQAHLPSASQPVPEITPGNRRVIHTTSLPLVLAQLDLAIRIRINKQGKHRRGRQQKMFQHNDAIPPTISEEPSGEGDDIIRMRRPKSHSPSTLPRRGKKGKHRASSPPSTRRRDSIPEEPKGGTATPRPAAWFLDVANPTWADLRAIGKVLHIHPLTLEDILQQDPREKLEIFSKLGYYFISFRAIEGRETRARVQQLRQEAAVAAGFPEEKENHSENDGVNGIGEASVYLAVFKDGICCFHFTDVSEHTDRVRNRMVLLEEVVNMSADWIAHDILDSIVDSFFPFLEEIDKEVTTIDNIVYLAATDTSPSVEPTKPPVSTPFLPAKQPHSPPSSEGSATSQTTEVGIGTRYENEKATPAEKLRDAYRHPQFVTPHMTLPLLLRRGKRLVSGTCVGMYRRYWSWRSASGQLQPPSTTQINLRRMARTRKFVTVLGRLLGTKSDVVTQIRKRLARAAAGTLVASEDLEVAIYMGDVQDHILTLQHALAHYERMLSQSHPTYLAQLRTTLDKSKGHTDMILLYLSVVSISVLGIQIMVGLFSLNVTIPHNDIPTGPFYLFGVVLVLAAIIFASFLAVVRYWWKTAKRKRMPAL